MDKIYDAITTEELFRISFNNSEFIKGEIKGVCTLFHGFENNDIRHRPTDIDLLLAEHGILTVYPFYSPWAMASDRCIALIGRILEVTYQTYKIDESTPLVITGDSMGGLTALAYSHELFLHPRFNPVGVAANCPAVDVKLIDDFRRDCFRAYIDAYAGEGLSLEEAMKKHSPNTYADEMLRIPYYILWSKADNAVDKYSGAGPYIPLLREKGYDVTESVQEFMGHCNYQGKVKDAYWNFVIDKIEDCYK